MLIRLPVMAAENTPGNKKAARYHLTHDTERLLYCVKLSSLRRFITQE